MSLMWHIVRKDVRRMAIPVGIWLGLVFLGALWFVLMPRPERWNPVGLLVAVRYWSTFVTYILGIVGFILVGAVVLEDPAAGTAQFWATRPVGHGRMFLAKLSSVAAMFIIAPALLLVPIWLGAGFSIRELGLAAWHFVVLQAAITFLAVALAATAEDLRQFLGITFGLGLVVSAIVWASHLLGRFDDIPPAVWETRLWLVQWFCVVPLVGFAVTNQYLSRNRTRTAAVSAGILALALGVGLGWQGAFESDVKPRAAGSAALIEARKLTGREGQGLFFGGTTGARLDLRVTSTEKRPKVVAPLSGTATIHWPEPTKVRWWPVVVPAPDIVRAIALGQTLPESVEWAVRLGRLEPRDLVVKSGPLVFEGVATLGAFEPERMGELAVRAGSELVHDSNRVRVVSVDEDPHTGVLDGIVIEERDPWLSSNPEPWFGVTDVEDLWGGRRDGYVLRLQKPREDLVLGIQQIGAVRFHSMQLSYRTLVLPGRREVVDLSNASIVKVRLREAGRIVQQIPAQQVPVVFEEVTR